MYTLLLKTMTKSQTSKNTQSAKQIVRQISGITSRRSVSSISGTRKAREEFEKKYPGVRGARDIARFRSKKINPGGKESYLIYDDKGLTGIDNPKINPGAKSVSKLQTKLIDFLLLNIFETTS